MLFTSSNNKISCLGRSLILACFVLGSITSAIAGSEPPRKKTKVNDSPLKQSLFLGQSPDFVFLAVTPFFSQNDRVMMLQVNRATNAKMISGQKYDKEFKADLARKRLSEVQFYALFCRHGLFSQIRNLNLSETGFDERWIQYLPASILDLKVQRGKISGTGAQLIASRLSNLESLEFEVNGELNEAELLIGDDGLEAISGLTRLRKLVVPDAGLTWRSFFTIANQMKNIRFLTLSWNHNFGQDQDRITAGLVMISKELKSLEYLDISNLVDADETVVLISENLQGLKSFKANENNISNVGAIAISKSMKNLTELELGGNWIFFDGVQAIVKNLAHLEKFVLYGNRAWVDWDNDDAAEGLQGQAEVLAEVEDENAVDEGDDQVDGPGMDAEGDEEVTELNSDVIDCERSLRAIETMTQLHVLDISGNPMDFPGAVEIFCGMTQLRELNIVSNGFGHEDFETIRNHLVNLEVFTTLPEVLSDAEDEESDEDEEA